VTYLYAGLGMAMLTAIMAMFETAVGLGQSNASLDRFTYLARDEYLGSGHQSKDKAIYSKAISLPADDALCDAVRSSDKSLSAYKTGKTQVAYPDKFSSSYLRNACFLKEGNHRVVLAFAPARVDFFSCILDQKEKGICKFESDP